VVTIDLPTDAIDVQAMLQDAVRKYAARHKASATTKEYPLVTRIDLAFSLGDSESTPWVCLYFDTKPGSEPDGDPTHPNFAMLERESWLPAFKAVCDGDNVCVTQTNGATRHCGDEKLTETVGEFLVEMLLKARDTGVFADLPMADRCELGVEDPTTGAFGWPNYEDRGKKNLVK